MKSKNRYEKVLWIIFGVAILAIIAAAAAIVCVDSHQFQHNQKILKSLNDTTKTSHTLVVFYSRSGKAYSVTSHYFH